MFSNPVQPRSVDKVPKGHDAQNTLMILAAFFIPGIINAALFLMFGFRTLISPLVLLVLYVASTLTVAIVLRALKLKYWGWKSFVIAPTAINLFLVLNYFGSSNPVTETYKFYQTFEEVASGSRYMGHTRTQNSTLIMLENNAYEKFFGVRVFSSVDKFEGHSQISYTFEKGLFGLRVMKDYSFH